MNNQRANPLNPYFLRKSYIFKSQVTVAINSTGQITFAIDSSYDFIATGWTYKSTGIFLVQFFDNERKIFNDLIPNEVFNGWWTNMVANGNRHWNTFKPKGYLFRAKSNINVALEDVSGAENTIKIMVEGYRVYREAVI